jgi:hypothetical protein
MPALPYPKYGIRELYLFPYYDTRERFQAETGIEPPPFDPTRPPKHWFDPNAAQSTKRTVIYENALAMSEDGHVLKGEDGRPMLDSLGLKKEHAATVNIPIKKVANEPGADVPAVPVPLRPLDPDEELAFEPFGGVVVLNKKLMAEFVTFGKYDRDLLVAIARKLNVNV